MNELHLQDKFLVPFFRDAFKMMKDASMLDAQLAERMQAMVGFRNIAVHDYRQMNLDVVRFVIHHRLDDFRIFSQAVLAVGRRICRS